MKLPKQLQHPDFKFVLLQNKSKKPLGGSWQIVDYKQAENHNGNIGLITGENLIVIDCDNDKLKDVILKSGLPKTFVVTTSKPEKKHIYYSCKDFDKKQILELKGKHLGEIQRGNVYVVVPYSIHPTGIKYKVHSNNPIATVDSKTINEALGSYYKKNNKRVNFNVGAKKGERDVTVFQYACQLRDKGLQYTECLTLCQEFNEKCKPPLSNVEVEKCVISAYKYEKCNPINNNSVTLKNVYETIEKWLYIEDKNRIDLLLATVLSNNLKGTPIWLFFVGASGDAKSELSKSITQLENVKIIDQLTKNTLASGKKNVKDLGNELQNKSTILTILDMASLISAHKDEKKAIFGQFRTLYDGDIFKDTGSGVKKAYTNCHVTLICNVTPVIRDEYHIHQELGTRELLYDTKTEKINDDKIMDMSWNNEKVEDSMRTDLKDVIYKFIKSHPIKDIQDNEIPKDMKEFLKNEANRLAILRASGQIDWRTYEVTSDVVKERPTRVIKQFKRLYKSLKSLDNDYPDIKIKQIISHIVDSTGDQTRQKIMKIFNGSKKEESYQIIDIARETRLAFTTVKKELSILWNMKWLEREDVTPNEDWNKDWKHIFRYYKSYKTNKQEMLSYD